VITKVHLSKGKEKPGRKEGIFSEEKEKREKGRGKMTYRKGEKKRKPFKGRY